MMERGEEVDKFVSVRQIDLWPMLKCGDMGPCRPIRYYYPAVCRTSHHKLLQPNIELLL